MRKLILKHFLAPGDILMLTAAVRDLHLTYPGEFLTDVRTSCNEVWEHNPYITPLSETDADVEVMDAEYPLIDKSNHAPYHFIHGFRLYLSEKLGISIQAHEFKADIHLSDDEKRWLSQVDEITGAVDTPFWIMIAGGKRDFTAKWWAQERCQEVVDHFRDRLLFVQCGATDPWNDHPPLKGVLDLLGQTDMRQIVRLMYHASGVVCPVTMFMHLAAAVEVKEGRPKNRPCVVIAGGREPSHWEAYPHHQYLHRNGCLPCCDDGGCWISRTIPLGDGQEHDKSLCMYPVRTPAGSVIPKCLDMVTAGDVINAIENYLKYNTFMWRTIYAQDAVNPIQAPPDSIAPAELGPLTAANGATIGPRPA